MAQKKSISYILLIFFIGFHFLALSVCTASQIAQTRYYEALSTDHQKNINVSE